MKKSEFIHDYIWSSELIKTNLPYVPFYPEFSQKLLSLLPESFTLKIVEKNICTLLNLVSETFDLSYENSFNNNSIKIYTHPTLKNIYVYINFAGFGNEHNIWSFTF